MENNYRLYTFVNFYLSDIQRGIQTAHVVSELVAKYRGNIPHDCSNERQTIVDWAEKDKTIIVLNGGTQAGLENTYSKVSDFARIFNLPYTKFCEDDQSLNSAFTAMGIILPEYIYNQNVPMYHIKYSVFSPPKDSSEDDYPSREDRKLIQIESFRNLLSQFKLA